VIPNASVSLSNTNTNVTSKSTTNQAGFYLFPAHSRGRTGWRLRRRVCRSSRAPDCAGSAERCGGRHHDARRHDHGCAGAGRDSDVADGRSGVGPRARTSPAGAVAHQRPRRDHAVADGPGHGRHARIRVAGRLSRTGAGRLGAQRPARRRYRESPTGPRIDSGIQGGD
jgi:hypothetical protein